MKPDHPAVVEGGVFIAWTRFQRRAAVLGARMGVDVHFFHLRWEGANRYAKVLSYFVKAFRTLLLLSKRRPTFVILQLPPTPALYVCALYVRIARIPLVVDCHNAAIMEHWGRWPLTGALLRRATVLAHNDHVATLAAQSFDLEPVVLRTGIMSADPDAAQGDETLKRLKLESQSYVLLPWSLHTDEPLEEALSAIRQMPTQRFVLTGDPRKIDPALASHLPPNLSVPGYLPTADFNELFAHAAAVLVLTTRELTQLSGMAEAMAFEVPAVISDTKLRATCTTLRPSTSPTSLIRFVQDWKKYCVREKCASRNSRRCGPKRKKNSNVRSAH